jgi:hypothetical protein
MHQRRARSGPAARRKAGGGSSWFWLRHATGNRRPSAARIPNTPNARLLRLPAVAQRSIDRLAPRHDLLSRVTIRFTVKLPIGVTRREAVRRFSHSLCRRVGPNPRDTAVLRPLPGTWRPTPVGGAGGDPAHARTLDQVVSAKTSPTSRRRCVLRQPREEARRGRRHVGGRRSVCCWTL